MKSRERTLESSLDHTELTNSAELGLVSVVFDKARVNS